MVSDTKEASLDAGGRSNRATQLSQFGGWAKVSLGKGHFSSHVNNGWELVGRGKGVSGEEEASRRGFHWCQGPGAESVCHFYIEKTMCLEYDEEMKFEEAGAGLSSLGGI